MTMGFETIFIEKPEIKENRDFRLTIDRAVDRFRMIFREPTSKGWEWRFVKIRQQKAR